MDLIIFLETILDTLITLHIAWEDLVMNNWIHVIRSMLTNKYCAARDNYSRAVIKRRLKYFRETAVSNQEINHVINVLVLYFIMVHGHGGMVLGRYY